MTNVGQKRSSDELATCSVCHLLMVRPVALPCGDAVCELCCGNMFAESTKTAAPCTVCNAEIPRWTVTDGRGFKIDHFAAKMIRAQADEAEFALAETQLAASREEREKEEQVALMAAFNSSILKGRVYAHTKQLCIQRPDFESAAFFLVTKGVLGCSRTWEKIGAHAGQSLAEQIKAKPDAIYYRNADFMNVIRELFAKTSATSIRNLFISLGVHYSWTMYKQPARFGLTQPEAEKILEDAIGLSHYHYGSLANRLILTPMGVALRHCVHCDKTSGFRCTCPGNCKRMDGVECDPSADY